jgi:Arc/MetJ family transcription regulator
MKTTIEIDERRLASVMRLTGLRTRKAAVHYALVAAERAAAFNQLMEQALPDDAYRSAVDARYDIVALRQRERP